MSATVTNEVSMLLANRLDASVSSDEITQVAPGKFGSAHVDLSALLKQAEALYPTIYSFYVLAKPGIPVKVTTVVDATITAVTAVVNAFDVPATPAS